MNYCNDIINIVNITNNTNITKQCLIHCNINTITTYNENNKICYCECLYNNYNTNNTNDTNNTFVNNFISNIILSFLLIGVFYIIYNCTKFKIYLNTQNTHNTQNTQNTQNTLDTLDNRLQLPQYSVIDITNPNTVQNIQKPPDYQYDNYIDIPLMPSFCNCITFTSNNSFPGNYTYTQCSTGKEVTDIIPAFGIINVCGSNPSVDIEAVDILLDGSCVIDGECSTITTTSTTTTVTPTTTSTTTSALTCHTFTLYGGSLGRTFNFRQCGETDYINVNVPGGDSVTYCIRMPYFAAGAIDEGDCTP